MMPQWGPLVQLLTTSLSTQLTQPSQSLLRTQSFLKIKQSSFAFMREWVTAPFTFSSRCLSMAFCPQSSRGAEFQFVPVANKASNTRSHGEQELILLHQLEGQPSQSQMIESQLTNSSHQLQVSAAKSRDGLLGKGTTLPLSLWIITLIWPLSMSPQVTPLRKLSPPRKSSNVLLHLMMWQSSIIMQTMADLQTHSSGIMSKRRDRPFPSVKLEHITRMARLRRGSETPWNKQGPCSSMPHTSGPRRFPQASGPTHSIMLSISETMSLPVQMAFHLLPSSPNTKSRTTYFGNISTPLVALSSSLKLLSKAPLVAKANGKTKSELASSLITPSSTPPQLLWSSILRLGMSLHSSMLCLMTSLTWSSKEETSSPFGKERLVWKTNSVTPSKLTHRTPTSKVHGSQTHLHLRPSQEDLNLQNQLRLQALNRHLNQSRQQQQVLSRRQRALFSRNRQQTRQILHLPHLLAHHKELIFPIEGAPAEGKGPEDSPPEMGWDYRDFRTEEGLLGYNPGHHIQC